MERRNLGGHWFISRRSLPALALLLCRSGQPSQTIPNPNQERLGFPQQQTPNSNTPGRDATQRAAISRQNHAEALEAAEELLTRAQRLRDDLKKAGDYVVPASAIPETEKIEKLARKLRSRLKA